MKDRVIRGHLGGALAVCVATALTVAPHGAHAQGLLGDVNGGATGGVATPLASTWQQYTYNFNATLSSTFVTFLFRNDPAFTSFDDASLVQQGSGTNLLLNPGLETQGPNGPNGIQLPADWVSVGTPGLGAAGSWTSGSPGAAPDGSHSGSGYWMDGAVGGHDGIAQAVTTIIGDNYTLTFWLGSDVLPDGSSVDTQIYAGPLPPGYSILTAATNIDTAQASYNASNLGGSVNPVFQGGTLLMDQANGSYSQDFTLDGSATNTIDQNSNNVTFSGVFSDATVGTPGALIIANSGTGGEVVLTGTNSYTGATTINSGAALALSGAGSIATSSGVVDNGVFDISNTTSGATITSLSGSGGVSLGSEELTLSNAAGTYAGTYAGAISGSGGLDVAGGTETLSGASSYTGGTTIANATVRIGADAALGAVNGMLALDNGTLVTLAGLTSARPITLSGSDTLNTGGANAVTLSGTISGSGGLTATGGGNVTLSGTNSYTGTTTIAGGTTLQLASDAALGNGGAVILGDVGSSGTLMALASFTSNRDITVESGGGTIDANGNILTLGGKIVQIGVLHSIGGVGGKVIYTGSTTVNSWDIGSGTTFNTGTATVNGGAVVDNGGLLSNNGTLTASSLTVNGELRGTGTINAPTTVHGTLAPGNSPGTLTFNAAVTLAAGATTEFDIDGTGTGTGAGNHSRVIVTGAGNGIALNGVVKPLLRGITGSATNTYVPVIGQSFASISAQGGITGSFTAMTPANGQAAGLPAGTRFDALYAPNNLALVVTPTTYGNLAASGLAETANEAVVGAALDALRPAPGVRMSNADAAMFYPLYVLSAPQVAPALARIAPTIYGAGLMAGRDSWYQMASTISDQLAMRRYGTASASTRPGPDGSTIWSSGLGQFANVSGSAAPKYQVSVGGAVAGIDIPVARGAVMGLAVGGDNVQTSSNGASDNGTAVQFALYGGLHAGAFFVDGQAAYMHMDQDVRRYMGAWGATTRASNGLDGGGVQLHAGMQLQEGQWHLEPTLGLSALSFGTGAVSESSSGALAERIGSQSITSMRSMAGLRVGTQIALTPTIPVRVHALAGWLHEFADVTARTTASFQMSGAGQMEVAAAPISRDAAEIGAGFDMPVSPAVSLYGGYQATLGRNSTAQYVTGGARFTW